MKLVAFAESERVALGRMDNDGRVRDLSDVVGARTLLEVIDAWEHPGPVIATTAGLPVVDTPRLLAPIPQPRRDLFAVGKNYRDHVREFGRSGYDRPDRVHAIPTYRSSSRRFPPR
ncbi:hypothetical protein ACFXKC_53195 [Streptomyces sp. NPDC059340]|uniref:hypothetical protein n=1 Tax=Streptomyces sp. NPDC059340 TaxID=3346806 RepID=UPI0036CDF8B5